MLFHNSINFQSFVQITPTKTGEKKKIHIGRIIFFYRKTHIEQTDESKKKKFFYTNQHQFFLKKNFIHKLIKPVYNDWGRVARAK